MTYSIKKTNYEDEDFQQLTKALDEDLRVKDGDEHAFYNQFNSLEGLSQVIVVYKNKKAIGCGAFKNYDLNTAEIKRMYVIPEYQGKGIGSTILNELENCAKLQNFSFCILETGIRQPDAIALYQKNNYQIIENYGQYKGMQNSICFKKEL
ncbi:GNAT family N-acetyltransferase [Cellulophaga sp. Hel_I_12]|uniref:GNAT family N-acetyltransferase n=1 Tax=Cellulophaga sp. Hel_I_12 TaxID=1249972 RepID=UPI000646E7A4|nr:GNAT family N-acetyltransferase [Cellulophaga sp. Hel_I_12]